MKKYLNFDQFSKQVFILTGDRTSEKLLRELGDFDLLPYIILDPYALSRSNYTDELSELLQYIDKGVIGKIQRLRRGCQLTPITLESKLTILRLTGYGRTLYLVSRDEYLNLLEYVKKYYRSSNRKSRRG